MIVIFGAGPAGLYLAIKLKQLGIKDLVVYDPRAGEYTRPGHLGDKAFEQAAKGLNIDSLKIESGDHIKELERKLLIETKKLNIRVEKKRFIEFKQDKKKAQIIISDQQGKQEVIEADFAFDCSGSRRAVVNGINQLVKDAPFKLKKSHELPINDYLLAYVRMSRKDLKAVNKLYESYFPHLYPDSKVSIDALTFARALVKLRKLGWKEFMIPRCYGFHFPPNKACLYMQAPPGLAKTKYDNWIKGVLEFNTKPIVYERLTQSKTYASKPRLTAFNIPAQYLEKSSYQGESLPTVIALGDAQCDSHFKLGRGITEGFVVIDKLVENLKIVEGEIKFFDADKFEEISKQHVEQRSIDIIKEEAYEIDFYTNKIEYAKQQLKKAIRKTGDLQEKYLFKSLLREIKEISKNEEGSKLNTNLDSQSFHQLLSEIQPQNLEEFLIQASKQEEEEEVLIKKKSEEKLPQGYNNDLRKFNTSIYKAVETNGLDEFMKYFVEQLDEKIPKKRKNIPFFNAAHVKYVQNTLNSVRALINSNPSDEERSQQFFAKVQSLYNELEDSQSIRTLDALKEIINSITDFNQYKMRGSKHSAD